MESIVAFLNENSQLVGMLMMPFTYGFVGWMTNWVAIRMTFYPLNFWGIPPYLGWQGILPRKSHKMADKAVDVITERLIKIEEVFDKVDSKQVEKELRPLLKDVSASVVKDIIDDINPTLWDLMPEPVKSEIIQQSQNQAPQTIKAIIQQIRANIYQVFDLKGLVLKSLTGPNVALTVEMFQRVGGPEFRFIEKSGLYFGFLLGLIQMGLWYLFPYWWTLPLQGILVGYLTNYLALNMIFRPLRPKKFGVVTYQGLFLKRQSEVSREYAHLVATKILTPKKIMEAILYGKAASDIMAMITKSVARAVDQTANLAKPVMSFTIGSERYNQLKDYAIAKMTDILPESAKNLEDYLENAMDLEDVMGEKMSNLPPEEFENILRSAFQEDEFLLIMVGAFLGALVGLGQAMYFFYIGG